MFGLDGFGVPLGLALTLASALICIVYGIKNWNRGFLNDDEAKRKKSWLEEEHRIEDTL